MVTKRRDIIRNLKRAAKAADLEVAETEGGRHTLISIDGLRVPVPRHREIPDDMARTIYKEAEDKLGKGWWKK